MANYTVAAGGGNINAGATYVGGVAPSSTDSIIFTSTSGQLTVNTPFTIASIDFTNYTNTLTMNAVLTVNGSITLVTAMTIVGSSGLIHGALGTLTSNTKTWGLPITFNGSGVRTFADDWTISNLTHGMTTTGSFSGSNLNITGNISYTSSATSGTTQINLTGTGTWSGGGTVANNLNINTSGSITVSGTVAFGGSKTLKYTTGSTTVTSSTLTLVGSCTLDTSAMTWNNINTANTITITLSSDCVLNGLLTYGGGGVTVNGNNFKLNGGFTNGSATTCGGTTTFIFQGTGTWQHTGGNAITNNVIINTAGTLTLGTTLRYATGTITHIAGPVISSGNTLNIAGSCTFDTSGMTWGNIASVASVTVTLTSDMNVNNWTISTGGTTFTGSGKTVNISGSLTHQTGNDCSGNATLKMIGTGNLVNTSTGSFLNTIVIDNVGTGGTTTLSGNLRLKGGSFTIVSGSTVVSTAGNVLVTGTVSLDTSPATLELVTMNIASNLTVTISSTLNANNLSIIYGATNLVLGGTAGFTVSNLTITGTTGNLTLTQSNTYTTTTSATVSGSSISSRITLQSSSATLRVPFIVSYSATQNITNCNVTRLNSTNGHPLMTSWGTLTDCLHWGIGMGTML